MIFTSSYLVFQPDLSRQAYFISSIPYFSFNDSSFRLLNPQSLYFYLEDFEDGVLNTQGVTASSLSQTYLTVFQDSPHVDSVDSDDGDIDGSGKKGRSFYDRGNGVIGGIRFSFNPNLLGSFPTEVGIVWTDSYSNTSFSLDGSPLIFEAYDNWGSSLGKIETAPFEMGDGKINGTTSDDRFFGVSYSQGISRVEISQTEIASGSGYGIEVDHLQYGYAPVSLDPGQYLASYPDLIQAFRYDLTAAQSHYLTTGRFEGRSSDRFDGLRYIASNPDLIEAGFRDETNAAFHCINYGLSEGRSQNAFIPSTYLNSYDDLINAFGTNLQAASDHYIHFGYREGRNPHLFGSDRYIASHGDLIEAFGYDLEAGSNHFLFFGKGEGRTISFDPQSYLDRYSDLQAAFGDNFTLATQHYILAGYHEGRVGM